ncbi:MAG: biotin-dependent carboxyltransferase family protein [Pseudomonas sp.]|uniref:5-oxoprolinase subunit C family protein n=1 Tax=Pseudomonas sp. TaxID=306 RepID=UPI003981F343
MTLPTAAGLHVLSSTPFIQLQDAGRYGVRHLGVTQSGALDWVALRWANWLLGNAPGAAVLEITLGNLELQCEQDTTLALSGADLGARLNDEPLQPWRSFQVRSGQRLSFAQPRNGARAYLSAPGGFIAAQVLGSCASNLREGLGGLQGTGGAINKGDQLTWSGSVSSLREVPAIQIPRYEPKPQLDLVMGAQIADFSGQSLFDAFNNDWTLDTRADRMGIRLLGPVLQCRRSTMVSEGIPLGAVQVPPDGQPIILLNDRQTIGGYPRLGALTPLAVARLAQCLPGETLRLRPEVQELAQVQHQQLLATWRDIGN